MSGTELLSDKVIGWIISGLISLVFWLIQRWLEPGSKLAYWVPHDFRFDMPIQGQPAPLAIQTSTLTVQNLGRKSAEAVEIVHGTKPDHFQLHPRRDYEEHQAPDGTHVITVESLGPKEVLQVQVLSHVRSPVLVGVRSKDGPGKSIRFQVFRVYPRAVTLFLQLCMVVGAFFILYWIVRAVLFISRANGML
ncbi:hypothetical protein [Paraburkholderia strydomiana]|uniref:hypothetical protein n=1 Tax=Paraburkholderia strydomiana TaxID=1245417 RepID=UPI001BE783F5|nr:hypothetical protein [Paraburkholderia strydomiana]MBT2791218.1 hypothetical protein [Paraburkholderia strydomiana]